MLSRSLAKEAKRERSNRMSSFRHSVIESARSSSLGLTKLPML